MSTLPREFSQLHDIAAGLRTLGPMIMLKAVTSTGLCSSRGADVLHTSWSSSGAACLSTLILYTLLNEMTSPTIHHSMA